MPSRRTSSRIPYEEAICLARLDGEGRLYGRGLELGATDLSVICDEPYPVGTPIRLSLLLPHGPRPVTGRVARVTELPNGAGLEIAFERLKPGTVAALESLIAERAKQLPPESEVEAVEAASGDGAARPAQQGAPTERTRSNTARYGLLARLRGSDPMTPLEPTPSPPTKLPPPLGRSLPSVVISLGPGGAAGASPTLHHRRAHGTAEVARHPSLAAWVLPGPSATARTVARLADHATLRVAALESTLPKTWALWLLVPVGIAVGAALARLR